MNDMQMRCFLMVAKHLNFTHAANQMFLSQQAVSKYVAKLEEELDCELLIRSTREVKLTYAGECYKKVFTDFFDALADAEKRIEIHSIQQEGILRLGILYDITIPQDRFRMLTESARAAGLEMRIERYEMMDIIQLLIDGKLDLVVTYGSILERSPTAAHLDSLKIQDFSLVFNFSELHPRAAEFHAVRDLDGELFITYRQHNDRRSIAEVRKDFAEKLLEHGVRSTNVEVMPNMASVDTAVEMGLGIGKCSTLNVSAHKPGIHSIPAPNSQAELIMAWRRDSVTLRQQEFITNVREKLP